MSQHPELTKETEYFLMCTDKNQSEMDFIGSLKIYLAYCHTKSEIIEKYIQELLKKASFDFKQLRKTEAKWAEKIKDIISNLVEYLNAAIDIPDKDSLHQSLIHITEALERLAEGHSMRNYENIAAITHRFNHLIANDNIVREYLINRQQIISVGYLHCSPEIEFICLEYCEWHKANTNHDDNLLIGELSDYYTLSIVHTVLCGTKLSELIKSSYQIKREEGQPISTIYDIASSEWDECRQGIFRSRNRYFNSSRLLPALNRFHDSVNMQHNETPYQEGVYFAPDGSYITCNSIRIDISRRMDCQSRKLLAPFNDVCVTEVHWDEVNEILGIDTDNASNSISPLVLWNLAKTINDQINKQQPNVTLFENPSRKHIKINSDIMRLSVLSTNT